VQRRNQYRQIVRGVGHARQRSGKDLILGLGWALMCPTCNLHSLHEVWELAKEFHAPNPPDARSDAAAHSNRNAFLA